MIIAFAWLLGAVELVGEGGVEGRLEVIGGEVDEKRYSRGESRRHGDADVPRRVDLWYIERRVHSWYFAFVFLLHHELIDIEIQSLGIRLMVRRTGSFRRQLF